MKIVQMFYYPGQGGAEQVSYLLTKEAIKAGDDVVYVFSQDGPLVKRVKSLGCPVYFIKMRSPFDIIAIIKLVKLFKKIKPDVIHTAFLRENFLSIAAGKISGVGGIFSSVHRIEPKTKVQAIFNKIYSYRMSKFIATSIVAEKYLLKEGIEKSKVKIIYNGIELPLEKITSKPSSSIIIIGFMGRLSEEKNVSLLLQAVSKLQNKNKINVLVVGDGPCRNNLEKEVNNLGLDNVVSFEGYSNNPTEYYKKIDILVLPSKIEVFPMVILEASSYGVAVVASDVGGVSEGIEDGINGILFKSQDIEQLTKILDNIIENPKTITAISEKAIINANKFSSKLMYEKTRELYLEALNDK